MRTMINKAGLLIIFTLFCGTLEHLAAQAKKCYDDVRQDGISFFNNKNYSKAIDNFIAALNCPDKPLVNDIYDQIKRAQKAIEDDLIAKRNAAMNAEAEARKALDVAIKAKEAESLAKAEAEKNAEIARFQGKQAEMLRLAILADNRRIDNKPGDALFLAYLSIKLKDNLVMTSSQMRAFSQAVWDTLNHPIAQADLPFKAIYPLTNGEDYLAIQEDQQQLMLLSKGKKISIQTGKDTLMLANAIAQSGDDYLFGSTSGRAWLWNASTQTAIPIEAHAEPVLAASASSDGQYWLTTSRDNQAKLWSKEGKFQRSFLDKTNVYNALFSPDGQSVLTRAADGSLKLWNLNTGTFIQLSNAPAYSYATLFSVKGNRILAGGHDGKLYRWDQQGNPLPPLTLHDSPIRQLRVSPQKGLIYSIAADSSMALINPEGELIRRANDPKKSKTLFSVLDPQDHYLAAAGMNNAIYLEHFERGEIIFMEGHQAEITSLVFSPDGQSLLSTSKDGVLRLWDVYGNLWMEVNTGGSGESPLIAAFSGDGKKILVSSGANRTLLECPMPKIVLTNMQEKEKALAGRIEQVKRQYGVQFLE